MSPNEQILVLLSTVKIFTKLITPEEALERARKLPDGELLNIMKNLTQAIIILKEQQDKHLTSN